MKLIVSSTHMHLFSKKTLEMRPVTYHVTSLIA